MILPLQLALSIQRVVSMPRLDHFIDPLLSRPLSHPNKLYYHMSLLLKNAFLKAGYSVITLAHFVRL